MDAYGELQGDEKYTVLSGIAHLPSILLCFYSEKLLGGFWFIGTLLRAIIVYWLVMYLIMKLRAPRITVAIIMLLIVMLYTSIYRKIPLPLGEELVFRVCFATFFISLGNCFHNLTLKDVFAKWIAKWWPILVGGGGIAVTLIERKCLEFSFIDNPIGVAYYVVGSVSGILLVYLMSQFLERTGCRLVRAFLVFVGDNSLLILTWHLLVFKLVSRFIIYFYSFPGECLGDFPILKDFDKISYWFIVYFVAGVLLPLFVKYLLSKIRLLFSY